MAGTVSVAPNAAQLNQNPALSNYSSLYGTANNQGYRQWLQGIANQGGTVGREAAALLQVVGNDQGIDAGFLGQQYNNNTGTYNWNGGTATYSPQRGQINSGDEWYGPQGVQQLNSIFSDIYGGKVGSATTGLSSGGANAAANQQYDFYKNQANSRLGQLDSSYNAGLQGLNQSYNQQSNELTSARDAADQNYGKTNTQNQQQYQSAYNRVSQNGAQQLRGLLSYLASIGGGGTDADVLRSLTGQGVSQELAGSGSTYAQNADMNNTVYNQFKTNEGNQRKQLDDWRDSQRTNAESQYNQTKGQLLEILSGLNNRAASADVLGSQLNSLNIPNTTFTPASYTGVTPTYEAPSLSSYQTGLPTNVTLNPGQSAMGINALANYPLAQGKKEQQNLVTA